MQNFASLLDSLVDARERCCCVDGDSKAAETEALAIAERAVALMEDWDFNREEMSDKDKETLDLLMSLVRNTISEFSDEPSSLSQPSGSALPSPAAVSSSLQELTESINADYQRQQILPGLYRVQGKNSFSSFSATSDGASRLARSSSSFSSASLSSATTGAPLMPAQRSAWSSKAPADSTDRELVRAQSSGFDESLHTGANRAVTDSVDPSNATKHTTASNAQLQVGTNEEDYDYDAMMCFTQIPVPEFPVARTDEEAERTVLSTLETHPSVAVCEALVKQVLVDRVLALSGDVPPTRSLCASLFAVYDAYPSVVTDIVLGPVIKGGFSSAQADVLGKFAVHAKLSPDVIKWLAESLRASPCGASELAVGLFQSLVALPEWSQLGPPELYAVSKWLQHAEPSLRKSLKFSSLLLALLKKHSSPAAATISDTQAKKGSYSQGNEEYMSLLKSLAKTNESMLKRTLIKFCN